METIKKKNLNNPEEKREFPKGQVELVSIGNVTFGKGTFQPGWKWSESVKPIAKTDSCRAPHTQYHISGRLHVRMDDGTEMEYGPGDVGVVPPGHDAWVIGSEPVIVIDFTGFTHYAEHAKQDHHHARK
jgi:ethanolamine utilization protein EutQ (cupin superfamily)